MELYKKHIDEDCILHLGANIESVIVDIDSYGNITVKTDKELIEKYGISENGGENGKNDASKNVYIGVQTSRIDNKPMG